MSKATLWMDKHRDSAQTLITWLLSQRGGNGWPLDWKSMAAFRELMSLASNSLLNEASIMRTLAEMAKDSVSSVEDFEQIHHGLSFSNPLQTAENDQRWAFFVPLQMTLEPDVATPFRVQIQGQKFSIIRKEQLLRQLDAPTRNLISDMGVIFRETGCDYQELPDTFLKVLASAPTWEQAWREVVPAFDILRGLIEITVNLFRYNFQYRRWGRKKAHGYLPHPRWMVGYLKRHGLVWVPFLVESQSLEEFRDYNSYSWSTQALQHVKNNSRPFKSTVAHGSILSLVGDGLRLYAQALDSRTPALTLLGLWQLAETLTNSERHGGQTDVVVNRIAWHGTRNGLVGSGYRATLTRLARTRNDIVHRGIFNEIDDEDINLLKLACEHALLWLLSVKRDLPRVSHLEHYYRLREINYAELGAVSDVVGFIRHERKHKR